MGLTITKDGRVSGYITARGPVRLAWLDEVGDIAGDSHYFDAARFSMMATGARNAAKAMQNVSAAATTFTLSSVTPDFYKLLTGYRGSSSVPGMTMTDEIASHTCRGCGEEFSTAREASPARHDCPNPPVVSATDTATDAVNRIRDRRADYERRMPTPQISADALAETTPDPALVAAYRTVIDRSYVGVSS